MVISNGRKLANTDILFKKKKVTYMNLSIQGEKNMGQEGPYGAGPM